MARRILTFDYSKDYYRGFAKIYFNRILDTLIDLGNLRNESGLVLDFGCGFGHLKTRLNNQSNIIGYDTIPELSEIDDYKNIKPAKIVLASVLEHLYLNDIEKLLAEFKNMNPAAELLIVLPTENLVSQIAKHLAGQSNAHDYHVSTYKQINRLIEKRYHPAKRKYVFLKMAQVTRYVSKS